MMFLPLSIAPGLTSPLLKIPLLLSGTKLTALAMTPPTPPPKPEEKQQYSGKADPMKAIVAKGALLHGLRRGVYWANAFLETAALLAEHFSSPASDAVLSLLIRDAMRPTHHIRFTRTWLAGCALMHCGAILRLACYRTLGRFFTWELSIKKEHVLVTKGPYSVVRHPSYTAVAMIGVGVVLCHFSPGSWYAECIGWDTWASRLFSAAWTAWCLLIPCLLMGRVNTEDDVLRQAFGGEWETYAQKTPYRLIPYIY